MAAARLIAGFAPVPSMVIALGIGIALNPLARRRAFQPGLVFCLKTLLRWAAALLGLRIALGEIVALGLTTAILVLAAMATTLGVGFLLARLFALERAYGALAGAGTAVCGASATLATSIVLPDYKGKEMDVAFVVVAVNALSTVAMVFYPLICVWLGLRRTDRGRDARGNNPRRRASCWGRICGIGNGRQYRGDCQVISGLPDVTSCACDRLVVRKASRGKYRRQGPDPTLCGSIRRSMRAQQQCGFIASTYAAARLDQASLDRSLDMGAVDRNLGTRTWHVANRDRLARMAPPRDGRRHDAGHLGRGDGRPGHPAVKDLRSRARSAQVGA